MIAMRLWWVVAWVVLGSAGLAEARDGIVLESYEGARPASADQALAPVLDELSSRQFEAGSSIGRLYESKVSRPRQSTLPDTFAKQLSDGQQEYIRGNYSAAVEKLQPLIDSAHDNSGAFAQNQALRQTMLDGLVALALAQDRNGDPKTARLTFEELARSFPDASVPAQRWGASAAKQFAEIQRDLKQQSLGRLIVKAPSNAEVYVNERFEQTGNVIKNVLPGEYRIFAREGAKQSRTYRVKVNSVVDATVTIDLELDTAIHSSPGWTGFEYRPGDRERFEAKHAAAFAIAIEERGVIVVGIDQTKGVIFGALVNLSGRDERRGMVPLTAGETLKRSLARFLAGDAPGTDVVVIAGPGAPGNTVVTRPVGGGDVPITTSKARWRGWPILTGIATLGAVGASVYFFKTHDKCTDGSDDPNCPRKTNRLPGAYASIGAAAVFAGLTVYLIVTNPTKPDRTAFVVPTQGGAIAGVSVGF